MRFSDLKTRVITAIFLIVGFLLVFLRHINIQDNLMSDLVYILGTLCIFEFYGISQKIIGKDLSKINLFFQINFLTAAFLNLNLSLLLILKFFIAAFLLSLSATFLAVKTKIEDITKCISVGFIGCLMLVACNACLILISRFSQPLVIGWLVLVVAGNDIGAYFFGNFLGKHKLNSLISPKKTIEGSLGGLFIGMQVAILFYPNYKFENFVLTVFVSVIVGASSQVFDLNKSFIKRLANVKDSGNLLPGHGGFLDRLDGILGGSLVIAMIIGLL